MVDVSESLTRQVAELARLELSDSEVKTFTAHLGNVLQYMELLQKADVTGVEPLTHPWDLAAPMREDVARAAPRDAEGKPKILGSAPDVFHDGYKVPPIL